MADLQIRAEVVDELESLLSRVTDSLSRASSGSYGSGGKAGWLKKASQELREIDYMRRELRSVTLGV